MVSKIHANHARITRYWIKTNKFWNHPQTQEENQEHIKFLNGMLAYLSAFVTDEEWDRSMQVAEDALLLHKGKKGG